MAPLFKYQESKNRWLPARERLPGEEEAPRRSRDGQLAFGGNGTVPLRLGNEGTETEVAELAEENRAFDWGRERQSQADAHT